VIIKDWLASLASIDVSRTRTPALRKMTLMENSRLIATLNHLLELTKSGEERFRTCAAGVTDSGLRIALMTVAHRCDEDVVELESKIRSLGGEPANAGAASGSLHRPWSDVISPIAGMGEPVLAECESIAELAEKAYEAALQLPLPADVRAMVHRQYNGME
jgi:uncharacterized protein (TIGR02284 family)